MKRNKRKIIKRTKYRKKRRKSSQNNKNKIYYTPGTLKCTWKEKLPIMHNQNYILLYGIATNISNLELKNFVDIYFKNPIELYRDNAYINKIGKENQDKLDNNTQVLDNLNYLGVVIKKCKPLNTSDISDLVEQAFNNKIIKTHREEIQYIINYCKTNNKEMFKFPPLYKAINQNLCTMKLIKPESYIIVNPNIVVDVAIGLDSIQKMVDKYSNQNSLNKAETTEKSIKKSTASDKLKSSQSFKDIFNAFDRK